MRIAVFGSLNMDLALRVPHHPAPDETIHATNVEEFLGGKGANQAVAAARLGAEVTMIGSVGRDGHGDAVLAGMARNGIDPSTVQRVDAPTGLAVPIVTDGGEVSIIVAAGANAHSDADLADRHRADLAAADVLLLQGEVPAIGAGRAATIARDNGTLVVFNPAPVNEVIGAVAPLADVVIANRVECEALPEPPGGQLLVVTLGPDGARIGDTTIAGFDARVVDPTGAGDAFAGAFAVAFGEGRKPADAIRFANGAGSCAVEVAGAEPSMPNRAQILSRIGETS